MSTISRVGGNELGGHIINPEVTATLLALLRTYFNSSSDSTRSTLQVEKPKTSKMISTKFLLFFGLVAILISSFEVSSRPADPEEESKDKKPDAKAEEASGDGDKKDDKASGDGDKKDDKASGDGDKKEDKPSGDGDKKDDKEETTEDRQRNRGGGGHIKDSKCRDVGECLKQKFGR